MRRYQSVAAVWLCLLLLTNIGRAQTPDDTRAHWQALDKAAMVAY
jgi:hypothetical protein